MIPLLFNGSVQARPARSARIPGSGSGRGSVFTVCVQDLLTQSVFIAFTNFYDFTYFHQLLDYNLLNVIIII